MQGAELVYRIRTDLVDGCRHCCSQNQAESYMPDPTSDLVPFF